MDRERFTESGIILLNKPPRMTSFDCVRVIRKRIDRNLKIGHGGTLDPFSTGILIILIGKATRLAQFVQRMDKCYDGIFKFGVGTDTYDCDGKIIEEGPLPDFSKINLTELANSFIGRIEQIPPSFSAKRINKVRAYDLARQGEEFVLKPIKISIFYFILKYISDDKLKFELNCSSGTYVRALARDIGKKISSPCHCLSLTRQSIGSFSILSSNTIDDPFNSKGFIPFDKIDLSLPVLRVDSPQEKLILSGQDIVAPRDVVSSNKFVKIVSGKEKFIGLGKIEGRIVHPQVIFPS